MNNTVRPAVRDAKAGQPVGFSPGVHGAGGFVQDDEVGLPQKGPGQGQALPFAHTQVSPPEPPTYDSVVSLGQSPDNIMGASGVGGLLNFYPAGRSPQVPLGNLFPQP